MYHTCLFFSIFHIISKQSYQIITGCIPSTTVAFQFHGKNPCWGLRWMSQRIWNPESFLFSARTQIHLGITGTMFENDRKSLIQHCERSELRLQKFIKNAKKIVNFLGIFENLKLAVRQCYQLCQL